MSPDWLDALAAESATCPARAAADLLARLHAALPKAARAAADEAALAEHAMRLHRAALPQHGFRLGALPDGRGLASSWRRGDASALPFLAATPALALFGATAHALARRIEADARRDAGTRRPAGQAGGP